MDQQAAPPVILNSGAKSYLTKASVLLVPFLDQINTILRQETDIEDGFSCLKSSLRLKDHNYPQGKFVSLNTSQEIDFYFGHSLHKNRLLLDTSKPDKSIQDRSLFDFFVEMK